MKARLVGLAVGVLALIGVGASAAGAWTPTVTCHPVPVYCTNYRAGGCGVFHYDWVTGKMVPQYRPGDLMWVEEVCHRS